MSSITLTPAPEFPHGVASHGPVLRWMIFTGVWVFAAVLLWRYGLLRMMVVSDRTYISSVIALLFLVASAHCLWRTVAISRDTEAARRAGEAIAAGEIDFAAADAADQCRAKLPRGVIADHIRDLVIKADIQGGGRLDQTLLLRGLADRLRGSNGLGAFAGDTLMKLGLLGTIIGFIMMLAPIAGLDASDKALMKSSMGLMSNGMAVAMYTTLAGLIGSILLKVQYYALDGATAGLFGRAVTLTETRVIPALERRHVR